MNGATERREGVTADRLTEGNRTVDCDKGWHLVVTPEERQRNTCLEVCIVSENVLHHITSLRPFDTSDTMLQIKSGVANARKLFGLAVPFFRAEVNLDRPPASPSHVWRSQEQPSFICHVSSSSEHCSQVSSCV